MRTGIISISLFLTLLTSTSLWAQKDQICRVWYNQEKTSRVQVYQTGNTFEAKIIWLSEPTENGKPKLDKENPDDKLKSQPVMGMIFLHNLKKSKSDPNFYEDGKVYDPKNGKTYDCHLTYKGTTMELRGYVLGMSFLGRTSTWTLAEPQYQK